MGASRDVGAVTYAEVAQPPASHGSIFFTEQTLPFRVEY